ncbi:Cucumisin [Glycine max]|nr:Cucumisin [Glycine max]
MHQIWYNSGGNDCSMTSGQWYWIFVKIHMCQCKSVVHFLPPYMPFDGSGTSTDTHLSPLKLCHLLASHLDIIAVANMTYIVYMGDHPKGMDSTSIPSLHTSMAQKVLGSDFQPEAVLHSYKNFNAFVMKLTEEEAKRMAGTIISFPHNYFS